MEDGMWNNWNNIPHWLKAIIVGNIIQFVFLGVLRLLRDRYTWLVPIFNHVGPRAVRTPGSRRAGGCLLGIVWIALSFIVGHYIIRGENYVESIVLPNPHHTHLPTTEPAR
jgi:hypothetical protein